MRVKYCQVLSDDKKRALYDQYGEAGVNSSVGGPGGYTVFLIISFLPLNVCIYFYSLSQSLFKEKN